MLLAIPYPNIDPVLFQIGPLAIRWYALAYVAGLVLGWRLIVRLARKAPLPVKEIDIDDFLVWATLAVVLGGRLGYVLFYQTGYYLANPGAMLRVWEGGMSFHGGILGVAVAGIVFVKRRGISGLVFADLLSCGAPIGLFFGRLANFINGELFGRPADVPWAMVFPRGGPEPRHPSQLYEALLEGLVLFAVANLVYRNEALRRRPGLTAGVFIAGYGIARSVSEFFRQPDAWVLPWLTIGQALSLPMLAAGIALAVLALRRPAS
ncbi:MAG: prolipoprotein diacylglyceryl transferase [Magnetospirillum sp. WYHS-4]